MSQNVSRLKWGASGKRESVINYLMFDINSKFIVVCIFSFVRKSGTPPRWIIYTILDCLEIQNGLYVTIQLIASFYKTMVISLCNYILIYI